MMKVGHGDADRGQVLGEDAGQTLADLLLVGGQVEQRHTGGGQGGAELADDHLAQVLRDLLGAELRVGADELGEHLGGVDHPHGVGAEGAQPDRAELGVAHDHGVLGTPLEVGEQPGVDEVDLGLPRRVEAVLPALEGRQDRQVLGLEGVGARGEGVGDLALVDEHRDLRLTHDELGAHLDLVVVAREPPDDGVPTVVEPLDDVDELAAQLVHQSHRILLSGPPCAVAAPRPGRVCSADASETTGRAREFPPRPSQPLGRAGRLCRTVDLDWPPARAAADRAGPRRCRRGGPHVVRPGGGRVVRTPSRAHRVLDAGRRRQDRRPLRRGCPDGDAGGGDHRPRLPLRRLRVLEEGEEVRRQADHRGRGLPDARHQPVRPHPGALGRRRRGRRLGHRRLHPHDPAGAHDAGHAQPVPDGLAGQPGGPVLQAPHGPRPAHDLRRRPDRDHRVPLRRGADQAAARPVRRGPRGGRRLPGHLRGGELLLRADGPRARHRAPGPEGPAAPGARPRTAPAGDQRPALHARRGRPGPRRAAVRAVRVDPGRPQAVQVRRRRLLPQVPAGDAPPVARGARGLRQHAARRRALRVELQRVGRPVHAELPGAGRRERGVLVHQGGRGRPAPAVPDRHLRRGPQAGELRDRGHHQQGLRRLLPRRRRLHQLGQGERHPRRAPGVVPVPARWPPTPWGSPTSTRSATG